jgi:dTDP-4-dehydrorhamnose reductase
LTELQQANSLQTAPITVVFGADGFIGGHLLSRLSQDNPLCFGVGRRSSSQTFLDLARPDIRPLELTKRGITHAVIAAGISGVAACERSPEETRRVNVLGTAELVRQLRGEGLRVVALSSDYVFDGIDGNYMENSPVNPLNEYGRQKVEMEKDLLQDDGDVLVIRLSKVFDTVPGSGTLLDEMASDLLRGMPVRAAVDQYFCPTLIDDLVQALYGLLSSNLAGLLHLCAPLRTSRFDLAARVAKAFGCPDGLVQSISLHDLDGGFCRPLDTSMVSARIDRISFTSMDSCIEQLLHGYAQSRLTGELLA